MYEVSELQQGHLFWKGILCLWVFSAAVSALSPPEETSGPAYRWLYRFSHLLAANLDRAGWMRPEPEAAELQPAKK